MLAAMHKDGLITLPKPLRKHNRAGPITFGPDTGPPPEPSPGTLDEARPLHLCIVLGGTPQTRRWNEFIARYHDPGHKTLAGAQMRYIVHDRRGRLLALLGFSTAARHAATPRGRRAHITTDRLVCCILGYACLICRFGSRGRPELFGARGGERSEPERAPNRDGGRTVTGLAVRGR